MVCRKVLYIAEYLNYMARMDRVELLDQLRIDNEFQRAPGWAERHAERRLPKRGVLLSAFAIALLGMAGVYEFGLSARPTVRAESVRTTGDNAALGPALDASGYLVARKQATVSSKITGKVTSVLIDEGDHVQANQIIARLDDANAKTALDLAQASLAAARMALDDGKSTFDRYARMKAQELISAQAFDDAKAKYDNLRSNVLIAEGTVEGAQANLDDTVVRAPFGGIVTVKAAQPGEVVSPISAGGGFTRTGICTIVDMDSLELEADISENLIALIRPGMQASIRLDAYPNWEIPGTLKAIVPAADRAKGTVGVRVAVETRDPRILPDMGARVRFAEASAPRSSPIAHLAMPDSAVIRDATGKTGKVFVLDGDRLREKSVALGRQTSLGQEVLSGVKAGDQVIINPTANLADGMQVSVDNQ